MLKGQPSMCARLGLVHVDGSATMLAQPSTSSGRGIIPKRREHRKGTHDGDRDGGDGHRGVGDGGGAASIAVVGDGARDADAGQNCEADMGRAEASKE